MEKWSKEEKEFFEQYGLKAPEESYEYSWHNGRLSLYGQGVVIHTPTIVREDGKYVSPTNLWRLESLGGNITAEKVACLLAGQKFNFAPSEEVGYRLPMDEKTATLAECQKIAERMKNYPSYLSREPLERQADIAWDYLRSIRRNEQKKTWEKLPQEEKEKKSRGGRIFCERGNYGSGEAFTRFWLATGEDMNTFPPTHKCGSNSYSSVAEIRTKQVEKGGVLFLETYQEECDLREWPQFLKASGFKPVGINRWRKEVPSNDD